MKTTNIFDDVMDYIDDNIKRKYADVKNGIYSNFAYTDMDFNKFLSIATRGATTLNKYFIRRKLYFISKELVDNPSIPIIDISYDFSYSEQSSLKNRDGIAAILGSPTHEGWSEDGYNIYYDYPSDGYSAHFYLTSQDEQSDGVPERCRVCLRLI